MEEIKIESDFTYKLLVEGSDDLHVIIGICHKNKIADNFYIKSCSSVDNAIETFRTYLVDEVSKHERVGIVVDADQNSKARWESLRSLLQNTAKYEVPDTIPAEGLILKPNEEEDAIAGVWIMPDNNLSGMLEDFLALLATDKPLLEEVNTILKSLEHKKYKKIHEPKARIHTYLSWHQKPGLTLGHAIRANYLQGDSEAGKAFACWLKNLFLENN